MRPPLESAGLVAAFALLSLVLFALCFAALYYLPRVTP